MLHYRAKDYDPDTNNWVVKIWTEHTLGSRTIMAEIKLEPRIPIAEVIKVDTQLAWNNLEKSLNKITSYKFPKGFNHKKERHPISDDIYCANTSIVPWWNDWDGEEEFK
jgi:hypothetical protein